MKFDFLISVFLSLTAFSFTVSAQSLLTGTVCDAKTNDVIPGVNIVVKKSK